MAGAVVRLMLFSQYDKPGVPVPRAKLNEALLLSYKDHASRRKIPGVVIAMAQARLLTCLGMEMVEVERPSDNRGACGWWACRDGRVDGGRAGMGVRRWACGDGRVDDRVGWRPHAPGQDGDDGAAP